MAAGAVPQPLARNAGLHASGRAGAGGVLRARRTAFAPV